MSADDSVPADMIATLRIDLIDSEPPIWREIEVPIAMTLRQLHAVVQAAMGWEDAHLWEFAVGRERIASSRAAKLTLQALLRPRTTKLTYIYDFGDCWEHQLTLTKPRAAAPALAYPRYLSGENPAPPEDCGVFPASMRNSKPSPTQTIRITTTPKNGSTTSTRTASTISPLKNGSTASPTAADQPQLKANSGDQLTLTARPPGQDSLA